MADVLSPLERETAFREWLARRPGETRSLSRARAVFDVLGGRRMFDRPILGIVGSKGKGTATLAASATFAAHGLRVGTIMSPGVLDSTDRLRIDGAKLAPAELERVLRAVAAAADSVDSSGQTEISAGYLSPSGFFMLAGLLAFVDAGCDVVVLESGMGGASDEISLLDVDALLLTQVFAEHVGLLGDTDLDIAREKLGACGPRTRDLFWLPQPTAALSQVVAEFATGLRAHPFAWPHAPSTSPAWPTDALPPGYQAMNAFAGVETALDLIDVWGMGAPAATAGTRADLARTALTGLRNPGRLSVHDWRDGRVLVDSAVNRDGLLVALDEARRVFGGNPDRLFVCTTAEKDYAGFVEVALGSGIPVAFVDMPGTHLTFASRHEWPGEWMHIDDLPAALARGTSVAVGTVTFSSAVLRALEVDTQQLFGSINSSTS